MCILGKGVNNKEGYGKAYRIRLLHNRDLY